MKKGMVAATMTVATSLGLGCPLVAVSQTQDNAQQNEAAPASAPEVAAPQPSEAASPPQAAEAQDNTQQSGEPPAAAASQETPTNDQPQNADAPAVTPDQTPATAEQSSESASPAAAAPEAPTSGSGPQNNAGEVAPAPPEAAQTGGEAPAPAAPEVGGLETVVVTARRTAENLQKVPVAITAFSDKDLQREQINTGQDLAGRVPSLVINSNSQGRNTETPTIRGQGATFGASPGVIIYYAEVPLPSDSISNGQGGPGKFFDLANLQVLKGSQGTLFGRNTTGGALLLEPHKPDDHFEASARGELSNFNGKGVEGIYNTPITDELSLRVGAKWYEREGFTKDVATGVDYDNKGYRTFRLGLMWKPTDGIQNYLLGYYTHSADNGTSQIIEQINSTPLGCTLVAAAGRPTTLRQASALYNDCGKSIIAAQQARGIRSVQLSNPPDDILDTQALIDSFSYQLNDQITLRDIASYSLYKHSYKWDTDGSSLYMDDITSPITTNSSDTGTYTEEAQLQGNFFSGTLKFVGGLYYEYLQPEGTQQNSAISFGYANTRQSFSISRRSYGPYAQGTYDMGGLFDALDGLNLTAGARYSVDDQSGSSTSGTYLPNGTTPLMGGDPHDRRVKSEAPTYTVGIDYKLATTLVYGKVSRGYKSGGFSPIAVNPANYVFKPEFVMNYELGHKSDFMIGDMPLRVNSAVYLTDYTDMQRTSGDSYQGQFGGATYTAGKATIMGFETDATVQPFPGLTVSANYSYTYGKYNQFELTYNSSYNLPLTDCDGQTMHNADPRTGAPATTMHLECVPFQYVPKHQASGTVRYQLPVDEAMGRLEQTVTYSFTDKQYSSATSIPSEEPGAWLGAYGILNASFNWTGIYGSAFDLQLFGANLTDREYRITNSNVWNVFFFQSSIYGEPRTFGAQVGYHWGD
jgi:iron complex outermembrane receptor protein